MKTITLFLLALTLCSVVKAGDDDEEKLNCKLTIRTFYKSGKRKVEVKEVHALDAKDCKREADQRRLASDDDIEKVLVSYGWKN